MVKIASSTVYTELKNITPKCWTVGISGRDPKKVLDFVREKPLDPGWTNIPYTIVWIVQSNGRSNGQSNGQSRTSPAILQS
jgi:hypothetical protein